MGRHEKINWIPIIDKEFVREATQEEAANIAFVERAKKTDLIKKRDCSVRKIEKILTENPEAVVLIIDSCRERVPLIKKELEDLGIPIQTREAVNHYNERSKPFTIAIRRSDIKRIMDKEEPLVMGERVVVYEKKY